MSHRILVIAREFTEGGAAYLALRHLRRMAASRQIDVLVTGPVSETLAAELPQGVTLTRLAVERETVAQGLLATREAIVATEHPCLTSAYDVVIGSSLFPDMPACAAFAMCHADRKTLVLLDEGLLAPNRSDDVRAAMQGAILASDHVLPVSQGLLETLGRSWPTLLTIPSTVIPPPINPARMDEPDPFGPYRGDGRSRVVTVARLSPEKQLLMCLRVHRLLRDAGHDFHWHVVGEGIERPALEQQIAALGMADRFWLEGFQESPRAWMRHADLFVLGSRSEGCPTVIREALAEGTPVLSTDVNGARELIDDGVTGVVVPNTEIAIAEALGRLMADAVPRGRFRDAIAHGPPKARAGDETERLLACLEGGHRPRRAPDVTILIPTFNHATCLTTAIQSGLMQDFSSLEVVVCDDASSDDTEAVARAWSRDPRLRYVRREHNIGCVANYRRALEDDATGTWVLMLDGDDHLLDPCFVSKAMAALGRHADADPLFVQAGHRVVRKAVAGAKQPLQLAVDILPEIDGDCVIIPGGEYLAFVYETGFFTHLGTLYRRDAALRQGFYDRAISSADMNSLLRLALSGNVLVMKAIAGAWVQHGGNASLNLPLEHIAENVRIFREIAKEGAAAGRVDMGQIERSLRRYESRTLTHLFGAAVGKSACGLPDALKMLWIMVRVNPRVCLEPRLAVAWWRYCRRLAGMSWMRLRSRAKQLIAPLRGRKQ